MAQVAYTSVMCADDICKDQHQNNQHKKKGKVDSPVIWFHDGKTEAPIQAMTDPTTEQIFPSLSVSQSLPDGSFDLKRCVIARSFALHDLG
jgi:hypothetical protein